MSFLDDIKSIAATTEKKRMVAADDLRRRWLQEVDAHLSRIGKSLQSDIEKDAHGEGSWAGHVTGFVEYVLGDESHRHLHVDQELASMGLADIELLPEMIALRSQCAELGVMCIVQPSLHDNESYRSGSSKTHFVVTVSGW
ncbi:MAG: hypothetical protein HY255_09410 [Betaproteobacteria bacterium]|nr:hypothetical protein [Betaproteobacteria bacterium]